VSVLRPLLRTAVASCVVLGAITFAAGQQVGAAPNPILAPGNHYGHFSNGKRVPHISGGTEVAFQEEREEAAGSNAASDLPPDASASALGCANRGSARNPRVNQDCTLRRQAEEQVKVNPFDAHNVVAGQNDSRLGWNHCGFAYSLNGGATWGDGIPPFYQHLSPLEHTYDAASDPALAFDGTGRSWFSCVTFDINSNASGLFVTPSTPALKGSAYANVNAAASPYVVAEDASGHHFFDKEFIAGDMRPGNQSVYVTFTDFRAFNRCKRSNNPSGFCESPIMMSKWNGTAWTTPVEISGAAPFCVLGNDFDKKAAPDACNQDQGSFPVVLPNGDVYVAFNNFNTPTLVNRQLGVLVHVNGDTLTPTTPVKVGVDDETRLALCDFGRGPEQCVDSIDVRMQDFPAIALDPTNGNHLVATWTDTRASTVAGNYDIVVSQSFDGGHTWTDANGHGSVLRTAGAYFEPSVTVTAPSHRVVVSTYHANTAQHTSAVGDGTYGYGYLVNRGTGFGGYVPASDGQAYPSPEANATQTGFLGDYSSITNAPSGNVVYMVWADTRNASSDGPDEDVFVFHTGV
jgi:hypothetical protein